MKHEKTFTKVQELVYELKVSDAMTKNVITAERGTLMSDLRKILRSNRISGTPVTDNGKLIGIISIEDLIKWLADGGKDCPIEDKMTSEIVTLYQDEPLIHAVSNLERSGHGRFPVLDRHAGVLTGVITKGDVIETLLRELEIDYHEEEIHRYRASHIFEDIVADNVALRFQSSVKGNDFDRAGKVSSGLKKTLMRLGIHPQVVRRAAIASYEAEMNLVIYTDGGDMSVEVRPDLIRIDVTDEGPGIPDVGKAMQPGYSTAAERIRELGFGAGMGLNNIEKCADRMTLVSAIGEGTHLKIEIGMSANPCSSNSEAGK